MVFFHFLTNTNCGNVVDVSFGRYQQHHSQNRAVFLHLTRFLRWDPPVGHKYIFFNLKIEALIHSKNVGDATSEFVIEQF